MIEIPEAINLSQQFAEAFLGKQVISVTAGYTAHGFAWYNPTPNMYPELLAGKSLTAINPLAGIVELVFEDMHFCLNDGATPHYLAPQDNDPAKHQLLLRFDDNSGFYCSVRMYGGMFIYPFGETNNIYYLGAKAKPAPLSKEFTRQYFQAIVDAAEPKISAKALLATEQRIPGLGNGVLQDILFVAGIHPQKKLAALDSADIDRLYTCILEVLASMTAQHGRDVEKDLFGNPGGYHTILSSKTKNDPCPICGGIIARKAFLGGNVYFCPVCQPL